MKKDNKINILSFDITGSYAHFRKPHTTLTALSFWFPPLTTVKGMIAAILGLERNSYNEEFNKMKLGLNFLPQKKEFGNIEKINVTKNILKKPGKYDVKTQVQYEIIKDPYYRIYVADENFKYYNKLKKYLKNGKSEYVLYLGSSGYVAGIKNFKEYKNIKAKNGKEKVKVDSIVSNVMPSENGVEWERNYPIAMDNERNLVKMETVYYNKEGKSLTGVNIDKYYDLGKGKENIFLY